MSYTDQQKRNAARILLDVAPPDRAAYIAAVETDELHAVERTKSHPLRAEKFSAEELAALKTHLLDGGGVMDDGPLARTVMQAVLDDDWPTVFREMPHVLKSWFKKTGFVTTPTAGVVILQGIGPSKGVRTQHGK